MYECDCAYIDHHFYCAEWQTGRCFVFDDNMTPLNSLEKSERNFIFSFNNIMRIMFASRKSLKQTELLSGGRISFIELNKNTIGLKKGGNIFLYDKSGKFIMRQSIDYKKYYSTSSHFFDYKKNKLYFIINSKISVWDNIKRDSLFYSNTDKIGYINYSTKRKNITLGGSYGKYDSIYSKNKYLIYADNSSLFFDAQKKVIYYSNEASEKIYILKNNPESINKECFGEKGANDNSTKLPLIKNIGEMNNYNLYGLTTCQYGYIYHDSITNFTYRSYSPGITDSLTISKIVSDTNFYSYYFDIVDYKRNYVQVYNEENKLIYEFAAPKDFKMLTVKGGLIYAYVGFNPDENGKYFNWINIYKVNRE
jgi:hypothetical protein